MIRIKIRRSIFVRSGPGRNYRALAAVFPSGKLLEMEGIEHGENWKGENRWFWRLNNKKEKLYYWAGGVEIVDAGISPIQNVATTPYPVKKNWFVNDKYNTNVINSNAPQNEEEWIVNWGHVDLEIWKIWKTYTRGADVKVAVLDTGISKENTNLCKRVNKSLSKNFTNNNTAEIEDTFEATRYHGTKCAGLIGALGAPIMGVAPECDLIVYKVTADGNFHIDLFEKAIADAIRTGVHILSISVESYGYIETWNRLMKDCLNAGIIVVAAAGNSNTPVYAYPASCDTGCFSVGAYYLANNGSRKVYTENSSHNDRVKFLAPGKDLKTTDKTNTALFSRTSAATAYSAGVLALLKSQYKSAVTYSSILAALQSGKCTDSIDKTTLKSDYEGYGIINPVLLFQYFKNQPIIL
ncbi:MAG TPA: S8/S53 family peptidase [Chitinophagales bacterium]|nr:S8/S53 family peptidase [Chitinophagales bacterium]